jgi:RNA polymerase sigma factor for flagellar operon FliA
MAIDPQQYLPLVKSIVDRMDISIPDFWDKDDMISYGVLGLLEAVRRYKPEEGFQFATFAAKRIKGAILDALRRDSPLSRNCWQKVQKITDAMEKISSASGQEATTDEIAQMVNMDRLEVDEALRSFQLMASVSLEQTLGLNDIKLMDTLAEPIGDSPDISIIEAEQTRLLAEALASLEYRQRQVLTLYYYEELTLKEIAAVLNVGVPRVSQLKSMGTAALKKKLTPEYQLA